MEELGPDELRTQLAEFQEKSKELYKMCYARKSHYKDGTHNTLLDEGPFKVKIYFADKYKTWSVEVDEMSYNAYSKAMDMPMCAVHDPQYLDEILITLDKVISRIKGVKRKLAFME
tara:strand:+ start:43767 stop:44114 length:348 start_codon:yes stop_codon:yes gene_type:complete